MKKLLTIAILGLLASTVHATDATVQAEVKTVPAITIDTAAVKEGDEVIGVTTIEKVELPVLPEAKTAK